MSPYSFPFSFILKTSNDLQHFYKKKKKIIFLFQKFISITHSNGQQVFLFSFENLLHQLHSCGLITKYYSCNNNNCQLGEKKCRKIIHANKWRLCSGFFFTIFFIAGLYNFDHLWLLFFVAFFSKLPLLTYINEYNPFMFVATFSGI